jgi:hypothetical protein
MVRWICIEDVVEMYSITYDLWSDIIDDMIEAHAPLFEAMRKTAEKIQLSRALVNELKQNGIKEVYDEPWHFLLKLDLYDDGIGGFAISLMAAQTPEAFEQIKINAMAARGVSDEAIRGFEAEHGLDMDEEIIKGLEESFGIIAEQAESGFLFELALFDSEDIDNSSLTNSADDALWLR